MYDFGSTERHGIVRVIPVRLAYDDRHDRIYPLEVTAVTASEGTPARCKVENTRQRQAHQDRRPRPHHHRSPHLHDRLPGRGRPQRVRGPRRAVLECHRVGMVRAHRPGPVRSSARPDHAGGVLRRGARSLALPCTRRVDGRPPAFSGTLGPGEGSRVVVGFPTGAVGDAPKPDPRRALEHRPCVRRAPPPRWGWARAHAGSPSSPASACWSCARAGTALRRLAGRRGVRQHRPATRSAVPLSSTPRRPVEFVPPDGLRPGPGRHAHRRAGQPPRRHRHDHRPRGARLPQDHRDPEGGWFGKPDWRLDQLEGRRRA